MTKQLQFSPLRFQSYLASRSTTSDLVATELKVSSSTVTRWRCGYRAPSPVHEELMRAKWGQQVWDFLTEASDQLPK
jgi:DNA-binding transcriptional regulator YiaG